MQGFDLSTISDCYIGNNQVSEIWLGQTKIWPTTPPTHDYSLDYLTIKSLSNNCKINFYINTDIINTSSGLLRIRKNNDNWYDPTSNSSSGSITINKNDEVSISMEITPGNVKRNHSHSGPYSAPPIRITFTPSQGVDPDIIIYGNEGSICWGGYFTSYRTSMATYIDPNTFYQYSPYFTTDQLIGANTIDSTNYYYPPNREYVYLT